MPGCFFLRSLRRASGALAAARIDIKVRGRLLLYADQPARRVDGDPWDERLERQLPHVDLEATANSLRMILVHGQIRALVRSLRAEEWHELRDLLLAETEDREVATLSSVLNELRSE